MERTDTTMASHHAANAVSSASVASSADLARTLPTTAKSSFFSICNLVNGINAESNNRSQQGKREAPQRVVMLHGRATAFGTC
jgi:hypothetical protein